MQSFAGDIPVLIRSFRPGDVAACRRLYVDGLLGGKLAENDSGLDIDDIQSAYMTGEGNHLWVAELSAEAGREFESRAGEVVGMIGIQQHDEGAAEIRRLRVASDVRRRGIGTKLLETALLWCNEHGYLKLTLDTFMEREPAVKLFEKFHFRHLRTREYSGKELMYFYLDIYGSDDNSSAKSASH